MPSQTRFGARARQSLAGVCLFAAAFVAGCGGQGISGGDRQDDFAGLVAADEPRAVFAARDVLAAAGSAADAAVAMSFVLGVTMPTSAGLGGGGVCLVVDPSTKRAELLEFIAKGEGAGFAVPALARGMAELHDRYGRFAWAPLVQPAERLARQGFPTSRALATELSAVTPAAVADAPLRAALQRDGRWVREGDLIVFAELAQTLTAIRIEQAGVMHIGARARRLAEAIAAVGGPVSAEDLAAFKPTWKPARVGGSNQFGRAAAIYASDGAAGALEAWVRLGADTAYRAADPARRASLAGGQASAAAAGRRGATSFVVADASGQSVACTLTMGAPLGAGVAASGTGVVLARASGPDAPDGGGAELVVAMTDDEVRLIASAPRHKGSPALLTHLGLEAALFAPPAASLLATAPASASRHNIVYCSRGVADGARSCAARSDPQGHGLGALEVR